MEKIIKLIWKHSKMDGNAKMQVSEWFGVYLIRFWARKDCGQSFDSKTEVQNTKKNPYFLGLGGGGYTLGSKRSHQICKSTLDEMRLANRQAILGMRLTTPINYVGTLGWTIANLMRRLVVTYLWLTTASQPKKNTLYLAWYYWVHGLPSWLALDTSLPHHQCVGTHSTCWAPTRNLKDLLYIFLVLPSPTLRSHITYWRAS